MTTTPDGGTAVPADALAGGTTGPDALAPLLHTVLDALAKGAVDRAGPLPDGGPTGTARDIAHALRHPAPPTAPVTPPRPDLLRPRGTGPTEALHTLTRALARGAADPADPACAAHLHCPPLAVAAAADLAAAALNPSLDSWDQAPSATALEEAVITAFATLVGYDPAHAAGAVTSGGTESNLTALLLARDTALRAHAQQATPTHDPTDGIPPHWAGRLRVFCSTEAHFSIARSAGILGIGAGRTTTVPTDDRHRMDPAALDAALAAATRDGNLPVAVVATAGTTDTGSIDPLEPIAAVCRRHRVHLHVDASYGTGALFTPRLRPLLDGLPEADTIALDTHKLGWQPVASGILLARHADTFHPLAQRAAYLNPDDDEAAGYPSLLGRSLRTTRRADAFKIAVTLRALGTDGLGDLVERCHRLAHHAARRIDAHPRLELHAPPVLTTVVFRYLPPPGTPASATPTPPADPDRINARLRRRLLETGRAVIGRTTVRPATGPGTPPGTVRLKLTLLNPHTTPDDLDQLLSLVVTEGDALSTSHTPGDHPVPPRRPRCEEP
ncbi:pyridoxal phosphate-dependent decarboxylase family protein [Allostreptomyces psammosilenae]|uniref:L-2,4-diaminobutyrate decarboxylase n=1 Tax=Allostreptomyces psammosilenae TaxID=1892865 RepID=A0A852ZN55_9ACTN|nr:pyridoxal-dependent decarboxylase [Allostreptomyces psammosilenae]NYI03095.1 L-2,4-diaminobutyrate decarboxylase [Allostreptomyces psammosilenae]